MKDEWKDPQEEEYSFLQEVIKDEAGSKKTIKKKVLRRIGLGFVFGIVACFTFFASKSWMQGQFADDPETVTIPEDEEHEGNEEIEDADESQTQEITYRYMLQQLRAVAVESEKCLVELRGSSMQENWQETSTDITNIISGVIIADNGKELLILGKDSLAKTADTIVAEFCDGSEYSAGIKKKDKNLGICIYAVKKKEISKETWAIIQVAELGSSNAMTSGDVILVLGKPFGYDKGIAYGIMTSNKNLAEAADGDYRVIHTDISCYREGSGVILNEDGAVIGMLNQSSRKEGEKGGISGYAISDIKRAIELLSNGESVPYIGLCAVEITEEMQKNGMPAGIYVKEVEADSPAMEAGIQSGDIITCMGDTEISTYKGYNNKLMGQKVGSEIILKGLRTGADKEYVEIEFNVSIGSKE